MLIASSRKSGRTAPLVVGVVIAFLLLAFVGCVCWLVRQLHAAMRDLGLMYTPRAEAAAAAGAGKPAAGPVAEAVQFAEQGGKGGDEEAGAKEGKEGGKGKEGKKEEAGAPEFMSRWRRGCWNRPEDAMLSGKLEPWRTKKYLKDGGDSTRILSSAQRLTSDCMGSARGEQLTVCLPETPQA
jgi:hypothetical protein